MRPYLRVANVLEDCLNFANVKYMNFTPQEYGLFSLEDGDILLNEGQAPDLLGRPATFRGEIEGCCFQKTLLRFRAGMGVDPEFSPLVFRHYMHSGRFRCESRITTNIAHLTQVRFVVMEFPLPPFAEQAIVRRFKSLNVDETEMEQVDACATQLRQAVLKAAYAGCLVPQNLAEAPALAPLDRPVRERRRALSSGRGRSRKMA